MKPLIFLAVSFVATAGAAFAQEADPLPGTRIWNDPQAKEPSSAMVAGIARFLDRKLAESVESRREKWKGDFSSPGAYERSIAPNRARFAKIIGAVDRRSRPVVMSPVATIDGPPWIAETVSLRILAVRWSVFDDVEGEGLLLEPKDKGTIRANVVVLPDADDSPEALAGLAPGLEPSARTALRLAESGCRALVPTLIDRSFEFSGDPKVRFTNLTHREWIYRMAYETGRHPIGFEVETVRAGIDWFESRKGEEKKPIGVVGRGEGGLIALNAAAVDPRIDVAWVGGYFGPRERLWQEPVYRNVWGLLEEFGDAELAFLIAPRALIVEASRGPEIAGPPPPRNGRADAAQGRLTTPKADEVAKEVDRARPTFAKLNRENALVLVRPNDPSSLATEEARRAFLERLFGEKVPLKPVVSTALLKDARGASFDPRARMRRLVASWVEHVQKRVRTSELRRAEHWKAADASSIERWKETSEPYRREFWDEVIGRFPPASEPLEPASRRILDEPKFVGYAVRLPVWPDVFASGVLLLPKDLRPNERRPVVVCQHGLEGTPDPVVNPRIDSVYHSFGAKLADRGYIVYAPQNPYVGHDAFRDLMRRANPLRKTLFAVIVRQHERTLEWLKTLPAVDRDRIAFYGLSYGGKSAMRLPALLQDYCLSICSADFNEWVLKCASVDRSYSYLYTIEHDMYEFNLSEGFNYAEMAGLIAPRPFMVERGHDDTVAPDEWIGYEFAKVKRRYDGLGIGDRTELEVFNGGHMIRGVGTFEFLDRHLKKGR